MKLEGGHVVVIGGSSGIGIAVARLARHEGAEVTIAGRSPDKFLQAQQELWQVHTIVMDMTNDGAVEPVFAGLNRVSTLGSSRPGRFATARWTR